VRERGEAGMDKAVLWLIIIFTILFIINNTGELGYLMNLGNTI
jgi:hypothetical protein